MQILEVKFGINPKTCQFLSEFDLKQGDYVIVDTLVGQSYGLVESAKNIDEKEASSIRESNESIFSVVRKANEVDKKTFENNKEKEKNALEIAKQISKNFNLDMNFVNADYSFDGSKVLIDFISENRVDFRDMVKELASKLKTRIELRQIGIREQAKIVGGIGICGRVCCCSSYLKDFEKVSIKMAKVQGLSLNPTKISGACGRLMCCLEYENPYYSEIFPLLPKVNSIVSTPDGEGNVMYVNALKQIVSVKIENKDGSFIIKDFNLSDIKKSLDNSNKNSNVNEKTTLESKKQIENKNNKKNLSDTCINKTIEVKKNNNENKSDIKNNNFKNQKNKNQNNFVKKNKFNKNNKSNNNKKISN